MSRVFGIVINQRVLVVVVARRIVLAGDQHSQIAVTTMLNRASDSLGIPPHDLREMAATSILRRRTSQSLEIEPVVLKVPVINGVGRRPMQPLPPKQVLAERPVGMYHPAIVVVVHQVLTREAREFLVPLVRRLIESFSHPIVRRHELLRYQVRVIRRRRRRRVQSAVPSEQ